MPEGSVVPERYQQAEWIVRFVTDAVNHGRRDEMADCFKKSNVSAAFWLVTALTAAPYECGLLASDCPTVAHFEVFWCARLGAFCACLPSCGSRLPGRCNVGFVVPIHSGS